MHFSDGNPHKKVLSFNINEQTRTILSQSNYRQAEFEQIHGITLISNSTKNKMKQATETCQLKCNSIIDKAKLGLKRTEIINKFQLNLQKKLLKSTFKHKRCGSVELLGDFKKLIGGDNEEYMEPCNCNRICSPDQTALTPFVKNLFKKSGKQEMLITKIANSSCLSKRILNNLAKTYNDIESSVSVNNQRLLEKVKGTGFHQKLSSCSEMSNQQKYIEVVESMRTNLKLQQTGLSRLYESMSKAIIQNCKQLKVIDKLNKHNFTDEAFSKSAVKPLKLDNDKCNTIQTLSNNALGNVSNLGNLNKFMRPITNSQSTNSLKFSSSSSNIEVLKQKALKSTIEYNKVRNLGKYRRSMSKSIIKTMIPITLK